MTYRADTLAHLLPHATPGERTMAHNLLAHAIAACGYTVSVCDSHDGDGEWVVKNSRALRVCLAALASTGGDRVRFRDQDGTHVGSITLIWGNAPDGSELIADYSATPAMESLVAAVSP
jgi:hypothetical protein